MTHEDLRAVLDTTAVVGVGVMLWGIYQLGFRELLLRLSGGFFRLALGFRALVTAIDAGIVVWRREFRLGSERAEALMVEVPSAAVAEEGAR
jgi:hypothetical protein